MPLLRTTRLGLPFLLMAACAGGDPEGTPPDDTAASGDSGDPACADAPAVTWETFGQGFLLENCSACHAATAGDRHGAPADALFDTVGEAWAWSDRIVATATGDAPTEPPAGGVSTDDRDLLYAWLGCGTPGT